MNKIDNVRRERVFILPIILKIMYDSAIICLGKDLLRSKHQTYRFLNAQKIIKLFSYMALSVSSTHA